MRTAPPAAGAGAGIPSSAVSLYWPGMLLVSGPPGSGKSWRIAPAIEGFLARREEGWRLLVPTATMAEHLRNAAARRGHVLRPEWIATFSRFLQPFHAGLKPASPALLSILTARALQASTPAEFAKVAALPGFARLAARLVEEFSLAGCDPSRLALLLASPRLEAPFGPAFLEVYSAVMEELARRGLALRGQLLAAVAERIRTLGLPGVSRVYLDGFFSFNSRELEVLRAIGQHASLTVVAPDWEGLAPLRAAFAGCLREERLSEVRRPTPRRRLFAAPTAAQEAGEIARRILEEASRGRPFRDIGVVVRSASSGVAELASAFSRFGIPARFYFAEPLASQPAVQYLSTIVDSMRNGWDHELLLKALRMTASGLGGTPAGDRLDFALRGMVPGRGLAGISPLLRKFSRRLSEGLERMDAWPETGSAASWAGRVASLRALAASGEPPESRDEALLWRANSAALDAFEAAALEAVTAAGGSAQLPFEEYWELLEPILKSTSVRFNDHRRDVVHVIDVYEARQWELPVVFVCGLLEKEFPRYHSQDPIFDDSARAFFQDAGVNLRTAAERQREEEFLFALATSRATECLTLSYARFNAKGEENLRSFFLDAFEAMADLTPEASRPVRPQPARTKALLPAPAIRAQDLLAHLSARHAVLAPTTIESFLHCPFQFFAHHTLRLEKRPEEPRERLSALLQGTIVHEALARFCRDGAGLLETLDEVFERACDGARVPAGYRREAVRFEMIRNFSNFLRDTTLPLGPGWSVKTEEDFEFALNERIQIHGTIDRMEVHPEDGCALVIDYKYSSPAGLQQKRKDHESGQLVQGGLYMLAAGRHFGLQPVGMLYCGLKKEISWEGWHLPLDHLREVGESVSEPELQERLETAVARTLEAAAAIAQGEIAPHPADASKCPYCQFCDICRYELPAAAVAAAPTVADAQEEPA